MTKAEGTCKQQASSSTSTANDSNLPSSSSGKSGNTTPKDGQIIAAILKEMSIFEYEPRIIHQMIEFTYRYVSNVLEDAQMFSSYAKKKTIDPEDVQLAIQLQVDRSFANPPPRDLLLEIARQKNNQPLPPIKSHNGPRLPADRYSLVACNYKLKSAKSKPQGNNITLLKSTGSPSVQMLSRPQQQTVLFARVPSNTTSMPTVTSVKRKLDDTDN